MGALDLTELLVAALAAVGVIFLLRKRYDSNLPLLFYCAALIFTNMTDRSVNPILLYTGLSFALLLRFEFMNTGVSKVIAFFTTGSMCLIMWVFLAEIFGVTASPF